MMTSYNQKQTDEKSLLVGIAVGAVLGVAAGVLFAPQSGEKTRKNIKNGLKKASRNAGMLKDTVVEQTGDLHKKVKAAAQEKVEEIEEAARKNIETAVTMAEYTRDTVMETAEESLEDVKNTALDATAETATRVAQAASKAKSATSSARRVPKRFKGIK